MLSRKRAISLGLILFIFGIYIVPGALCAVLGTDPSQDLRKFTPAWLEENAAAIDDWGNASNALDQIYITLRDNWDNPQACSNLNLNEYNTHDYIDILSISITNLTEVNATFTVSVAGDAENAALPWMLFIWSNCSPTNEGFWFITIGGLGELGEGGWEAFFGVFGDENVTGAPDFGPGGSDINMNFPSDWWEEDANCGLRVMMLTVDNVDSIGYYIIDIYPNPEIPFWLNLWFWLIIFLIILAVAIISYTIYKQAQSKQKSRKPKRRVK